jgi:WD40 repeat protein
MPSTLPVDLAERVFASHPAPLAEAVWALETASTVDEQRECLGMVARTLLRLASATVLAARLQRGATAVGDSRRTRELIDGWRTGLLTDGQWLELIREVLRSPPPDFPLPGLIEVTQGSQGARFVMALKQLLALGPSAPLEEPLAQLAWLLERMDGVWSKIHLVVPEAAPAEADARQSVHDLTGVADANPFTGRELASHVRLPVDRPVLCTSDGKPLLALHPVAQWLRDIPGCGDGLFFLDGCEPADEVLHAYPSLVEHRVPRAQGHVPLPDTAKAKAAARRLKIAVATAALIVLCAGAWQYQRGWSRRAAESARLEAVRRTEEADRTAEAAFRAQTAQAIARTQDSVQHRITAPQYTTWQQGTILRLAETLDHADTPSIRNELLEARSKDRPVAWRSLAGTALGFSPDGMSVLLSDKGALNVVGTSDLALRRTLPGGAPEDALPVPHSSAALLSEAGRVCLAQLESAEPCKPLIEATVHVWAVAPDGTSFATGGGDASIQLRSLKDGKVLKALEGHRGRVTALAFAPGGKTLLSAGDDGLVLVWDLARGKERHRLGHSGDPAVSTMALSPNGRTLATVSADRQLRVWNVNSDSDARSFKLPEIPRELRFLPDGQTLLYAVGKEIVAFDTGTGQTTGRLEGPASPIARVLLSENGRWLLATGENQATRLWDLTPPPRSLQLEVASPDSLAFAPDGASIATANGDVIRWTTQGAGTRLAPNLPTAQLTFHGVAFSPDGQRLVTGDAACSLWLWQSGHPVQQWKKSGACESPAGAVVFSPGGLRLAQVAGGTVTLWDAEKGTELWTRTTRHAVRAVSFSPDGSLLAVSDGEVTIWKVATAREGRPLTASKSIDALAFSPDGRLVLASASEVSFWDTATGRRTDAFQANEDGVTSLVFSPRG